MSLSVIDRPIGVGMGAGISSVILKDTVSNTAIIVTSSPHGLVDDKFAYIQSFVEDYNGFWMVDVIDTTHFSIKKPDSSTVQYIVDADATIYPQSFTHGWSCVELPITYTLKSNLFPNNSFDATRTILAWSEDSGYTFLNLSGSLPIDSLEYVTLSGGPLAGVYRILTAATDDSMLIDHAWNDADDFTGYTVTKYYSNYHAIVNVYSGLDNTQKWASVKPYQLISSLKLIPDANNEIKVSLSDVLKSDIELVNNLFKATLPNNLDFFTRFYIGVIEVYDNSDGYTVVTQEGSEVLDKTNFQGYATNSMLEFKNINSGYLTDYIMNSATAKFLTLFAIPTLFIGCSDDPNDCYYDISFIRDLSEVPGLLTLRQKYYKDGALKLTVDTDIKSYDDGVYRQQLQGATCEYDLVKITLNQNSTIADLSTFTNKNSGTSWNISSTPDITLINTGTSKEYSHAYLIKPGTYTFNYNFNISADPLNLVRMEVNFFKSGSVVTGAVIYPPAAGDNVGSFSITIPSSVDEIRFYSSNLSGADKNITIRSFQSATTLNPVSEEKTININCDCNNQFIKLTWLNNLGGFEYFTFNAYKTYGIDVASTGEVNNNIFQNWPTSYGENANTINKNSFRESTNRIVINTQFLTLDELNAISTIKSSPIVQIINSRGDTRTVLVDKESFNTHVDNEKLHSISFTVSYTDNIPSQTL